MLCLSGCAQNYVEKSSEVANEAAYGVPAAIDHGRIDIADSVSQSFRQLYSYPNHPINTDPVIDPKTGLVTVILPARLTGKVFVVGSVEYQDLLKNKEIAKQLAKDNKDLLAYKSATEEQKRKDDQVLNAILKELNEYKASIFYKAYVKWTEFKWFLGSGLVLSILGFLVLIFFAPEAIPGVLSFLGRACGIIFNLIKSFFLFLKGL